MTRKDYELIARVIRYAEIDERAGDRIARDFAYALAKDNPRFDRARFLKACGVEDTDA
jgi:hypothetical protein